MASARQTRSNQPWFVRAEKSSAEELNAWCVCGCGRLGARGAASHGTAASPLSELGVLVHGGLDGGEHRRDRRDGAARVSQQTSGR